jgi:hypothetical protein
MNKTVKIIGYFCSMLHRKIFMFVVLILHVIFCNSQSKKQKVFDNYLASISTDTEMIQLKQNLTDSVQHWIEMGLYYVLFLSKTTWKVDDAVFLDREKNKALLIVLIQPNDFFWDMDYAKIIAAEKLNSQWRFYYASYPLLVYDRKDLHKTSLDTIASQARQELVSYGFVKCSPSCKVNPDYVDSDVWFSDWIRKKHLEFLLNTLEIDPREKPGDAPY